MHYVHKITRPGISMDSLYGCIVNSSDAFTLIAIESDFIFDGYMVLRNSDIALCKPTPTTRYGSRIMKKEGIFPDLEYPVNIDLANWQSVFLSLKNLKNFVIVEDEINDEFLIGPVLRVNQKSVKIHYFDGTGKWEKPQNLRYDDITSVTFNSNYIRMHQKYIKK